MIGGMTGYGTADFKIANVKGIVEIKTVNHRYLDIVSYLPTGFSAYEDKVNKIISAVAKRGRINVSVKIVEKPHLQVALNAHAVKRYLAFAKELSRNFGMKNDLTVSDIMKMPGVVETKEVFIDAQTLWPAVSKAIQKAMDSVVSMRQREGKALKNDIHMVLVRMQKRVGEIQKRLNSMLKATKASSTPEEYASFQKSNDISEEIARLLHHIQEAKSSLLLRQEAGKKLDFIAQEMQRETNTIGSKVQDKEVSAMVIAIKAKIEKIREQANNVE